MEKRKIEIHRDIIVINNKLEEKVEGENKLIKVRADFPEEIPIQLDSQRIEEVESETAISEENLNIKES